MKLVSLTVGDDPEKAKILTDSFEKYGHQEIHVLGAGVLGMAENICFSHFFGHRV